MLCSAKLVERYRELKAAAPGYLLLMQVGSFMQVQDEDARQTAVRLHERAHLPSVTFAKEVSQ